MLNNDKPSVSCDGEPLFFAGAGLEMTEARFPDGHGVKLGKGQNLMSIVAFYHKAPPTKNVMARFTMYVAPEGAPVKKWMCIRWVSISCVTASSGNVDRIKRTKALKSSRGQCTFGSAEVQHGRMCQIRLPSRSR